MSATARVLAFDRRPSVHPRTPRNPQSVVVQQVRLALHRRNRLPTALGAALGGIVPVLSFELAHHEVDRAVSLFGQVPAWLVAGGLLFSALTVYRWGKLCFASPAKALGFVLLLEGAMTFASTPWLSFVALTFLVGINATATGAALALGDGR
jgi:hypothetical protein